MDTDGDGISDGLEVYGYVYDWLMDEFYPWTEEDVLGNPAVPYFKSDPQQPSTDQDPYNDRAEASGLYMDVAVKAPGNLPMVPAYPDIVVKLERYEVTLNTDITSTTGVSLQQGETWNVDTYDLHTHTEESSWEGTVSVDISFSDIFSAGASASYTEGGKIADSSQTGTIASEGGSIMSQHEWETATATNPTDAARMKLFLKVYNFGTAPASNIIPTLTLRIGKRNIATFEPGNSQINLLEPGGSYPATDEVYWTVDSIDTGTSVIPISLTLEELRALETGAPVDVIVTQTLADVLMMSQDGLWVSVGNWHEYMARVKSVSAKIFFDIGDGNVIDYLVYAGDNPSAPTVTLRDALLWVAGGYEDAGQQRIKYIDRIHGGTATANLRDWKLVMDSETWSDNDLSEGADVLNTRLGPGSTVLFKAPIADNPKVHFAFLDERTGRVRVFVSDYQGIQKVEFIEDANTAFPVLQEMARSEGEGFYEINLGASYQVSGGETLRVTDADVPANTVNVPINVIPDPGLIAPSITSLTYDLNTFILTACVEDNGGSPISDVTLDIIGYPELSEVPMAHIGGCEYRYDLECEMFGVRQWAIAYAENSIGLFDTSAVTTLINYEGGSSGLDLTVGRIADLDTGMHVYEGGSCSSDFGSGWPYGGTPDIKLCNAFVMTSGNTTSYHESFMVKPGTRFLKLPHGVFDYLCISREDLEYWYPLMQNGGALSVYTPGDIVLFHTGEHFVKMKFEIYHSAQNGVQAFEREWRIFANP